MCNQNGLLFLLERADKTSCSIPVKSFDFLLASCGVAGAVRCRCTGSSAISEITPPPASTLPSPPSIVVATADPPPLPLFVCARVAVSLAHLYQLSLSSGPGGWRTEVHCVLLMSVSNIIANELAAPGPPANTSPTAPSGAQLHT